MCSPRKEKPRGMWPANLAGQAYGHAATESIDVLTNTVKE